MNTYAKYCPNVFLAKCEEKHEKGDIIEVTTKYGKANEATAKYSEYVGKKVRITGSPKYRNAVDVIGFFQGFVAGRYYPVMQVFKVRKDGTKSNNVFPSYNVPAFDDFFNIEIVE